MSTTRAVDRLADHDGLHAGEADVGKAGDHGTGVAGLNDAHKLLSHENLDLDVDDDLGQVNDRVLRLPVFKRAAP